MADRTRNVNIIIQAKNAASDALSKVGLSLGSLAAAAGAAAAAVGAIAAVVSKAVAAASEQERADIKLAAALRSVGRNTKESRDDLQGFIDEMEFLTTVSDEAISSVIATFLRFGVSADQIKRATQATLNYAAATGQDAVSAAQALGNVLVKGQGRLAGVNTRFKEGTSNAERFASALRGVETVGGNTAEALGKSFQASLDRIDIVTERILEDLGQIILEATDATSAIDGLARITETLRQKAAENAELLKAGFAVALSFVSVGAFNATRAFKQLITVLDDTPASADGLLDSLGKGSKSFRETDESTKGFLQSLNLLGIDGIGTLEEVQKEADRLSQAWADLQGLLAGGVISEGALKTGRDALKGFVEDIRKLGGAVDFPFLGGGRTSGLETLGIDLAGLVDQADAARTALLELDDERARGAESRISDDTYDVLRADILATVDALRQMGVEIETGLTIGQELAIQLEQTLRDNLVSGAADFGTALVDAAFDGKLAFGEFFKALLRDLLTAIVRALIVKTILSALGLGGFGGGASGGQVSAGEVPIGGGLVGAQHGGRIFGGTPGLDSVAAVLMPGEVVLPRDLARDFEDIADFASRVRRGSPGAGLGSGQSERPVNLSLAVMAGDRFVSDLVETINTFVERRGGRLISSEVLR